MQNCGIDSYHGVALAAMIELSKTRPILVADIGGTHARFALAIRSGNTVALHAQRQFLCAEANAVQTLLHRYLESLEAPRPTQACLASAGPGDSYKRHLTNLDWWLDASEIAALCQLEQVLLVNDFEALARGAVQPDCDMRVLSVGCARPELPVCVIGPGTGLGVAIVAHRDAGPLCIATEAAHMAFHPVDSVERALVKTLNSSQSHVHNELLLSGPGLERIHALLHPQDAIASAASISDGALAGDTNCLTSVHRFLAMLGSAAGDIALAQGARGGVMLGGGILPRWSALLADSPFMERFCSKGAMTDYMKEIPVSLITAQSVAERGAALLFTETQGQPV